MLNCSRLLTRIGMSAIFFSLIPYPVLAQIPSPSETNIDDLSDDPQQMRTWRCRQADKAIQIEAKDTSIWQGIIATQGWQCLEQISVIPDDVPKFSCESNGDVINIVTAIWLEGKGSKQQMQTWMNALKSKNMTCTVNSTNPYWD